MIGPLTNLKFILLILFIISFIFYVTVLCAIVKYRHDEVVSGAFFKFSFLLGVYDIIAMTATWIFYKLRYLAPLFEFYTNFDPLFARLGPIICWLSYYGQVAGLTIIVLNRFTCVVFPLKTIQFWNARTANIFMAVAVILPILATIPHIIFDYETFVYVNGTITIEYLYQDEFSVLHLVIFLCELPLCTIQLVLYVIMFVAGFVRQKKMLHYQGVSTDRQSTRQQIKLALTGFILTLTFSGMVMYDAAAIWGINLFEEYSDLYAIWVDFFNECNPYLLLICSSHLRKKYLEMFGFRKRSRVEAIASNNAAIPKTVIVNDYRRRSERTLVCNLRQ